MKCADVVRQKPLYALYPSPIVGGQVMNTTLLFNCHRIYPVDNKDYTYWPQL